MSKIEIGVHSEIGELEAVILHTPGPEVENMTPLNAERALYSDILNLSVARKEYSQLGDVLQKLTKTFFVEDLLREVLDIPGVKINLINRVCGNECVDKLIEDLHDLSNSRLAKQLIEGVPLKRTNLTNYLNQDNYSLRPLHNFFFTRDSAVALYDKILISNMANRVRERESLIMQTIFENHPSFESQTINIHNYNEDTTSTVMEGGDLIVAREDILIAGIGMRTSSRGIDFILDRLGEKGDVRHVIVQMLPSKPESFIHLDMVFTMLDRDKCMVYEPLILRPNKYETIHIKLDNKKVSSIESVKNIPSVLKKLGMDLKPVYCGGRKDQMIQEREQWHSGANFVAVGPGKVIGYARNVHTLEEMSNNGFEILKAKEILNGKVDFSSHEKYVITIDGSELSRGGGGARCMTMPVSRKSL